MKFEKRNTANGINIPPAALRISGFAPQEGAEYHALGDCVVVLKKTMNASELVRAAWALHDLATELMNRLAGRCGGCGGQCGSCDGECPYHWADFAVDSPLSDEARELGGISEHGVVHMEFPENGGVLLAENNGEPGLWDVPVPIMEGLLASGVCPASLEMPIKSGEAVYGD